MMTNTFCHLPGIGDKTERRLWTSGFTSWQDVAGRTNGDLPRKWRPAWDQHIEQSLQHYQLRNLHYFSKHLPSNQQWRLYHDFQQSCAFVDTETTGLDRFANEITTIVLYDGKTIRWYVNGQNLEQFARDIQDYRLLVTYNGKCFDVPFIESYLGITLGVGHIDVMYPLRSLGHKGGLKSCEEQIGLQRAGLKDVDGFLAVLLWQEYCRHDNRKALETLLAYNIQDALSLHALMVHTHNQKISSTPFAELYRLATPVLPKVPFAPDASVVERLRTRLYGMNRFVTSQYRGQTW